MVSLRIDFSAQINESKGNRNPIEESPGIKKSSSERTTHLPLSQEGVDSHQR
jgi:hypothetical protein